MEDREQCSKGLRCLVVERPRFDPGLEICSVDLGIGLGRPDLDHLEFELGMFGPVRTEIDPGRLEIGDVVCEQVQTEIDLDHLAPGHLEIEEGMLEQAQTAIDLDHLGLLALDLDLLDRSGLRPTGLERLGS